ncbi:hypothetical protein JCM4814A_10690 [Streptomyces phaeofaciens JCM 4814]|uniref:RanBP2-type domain-containing protein n=1 Tax=Streptomyces phaeofaciens TaxID=68254 RepID=A0A918LXK3_9ACTN|nr:hypothetical protein GCM10010226_53640 [Streptomyces phaeofaciens]
MAPSANWRCTDCDTYNGPAEAACSVCGGTRRVTPPHASAPRSAPKAGAKAGGSSGGSRPAAKRPGAGRPPADWRCAKCDTNNGRTDLSCIVCGTAWRTATAKKGPSGATTEGPSKGTSGSTAKGAASGSGKPPSSGAGRPGGTTAGAAGAGAAGAAKKAAPRKPTPKRTPPPTATPSAPRASRPGTSGMPGGHGTGVGGTRTGGTTRGAGRPPRREEAVFYPSSPTMGYRPDAAHTPAAAPPPVPPVRLPPSAPSRSARAGTKKMPGCVSGCLGFIVVSFLLSLLARGCESLSGDGASGPDGDTRVATACPARIAAQLPDGDGAELVEAFRTSNKRITLCRTESGSLYYYGEFSDGREKGIAMPAERTSGGYEARNQEYRYEIHDGLVTIYESGTQIGEEKLTPEPSPT